jgi:hypothetical protein
VKKLLFFVSFLFCCACATHRQSRLATTASGFVIGGAIGSATAPKTERQELHALYWAGLLGLTSAIIADFYFSDADALQNARLENDKLKSELELFNNARTVLLDEGSGRFKKELEKNQPGSGKSKWKIYQVDRWQRESPHQLYHIDKVIEITPSTEPRK